MGQQVAVPHRHNAAFVVNALENLSGGEALSRCAAAASTIALRARQRDSPRRRAPLPREGADARRPAQGAAGEGRPSMETKGGEGGTLLLSDERTSRPSSRPHRDDRRAPRAARRQARAAPGHRPARRLAEVLQHRGHTARSSASAGWRSASRSGAATENPTDARRRAVIKPQQFTVLAGVTLVSVVLAGIVYASFNRYAPGRVEGAAAGCPTCARASIPRRPSRSRRATRS